VESGAYLLTKRCQYIPVHRDSFDAPISPIVNVTPILRKHLVQEVYDDIDRGWLRTLCFPVVYHRRGKNHEPFALICPPDCTSLLGRESMCRLEASGRDHNSGSVMSYLEVKTKKQCQRKTAAYCINIVFFLWGHGRRPGRYPTQLTASGIAFLQHCQKFRDV